MLNIQKDINTISLFLIDQTPISDIPICDAIFIFGHVDKRVAEHAGKLFLNKKAPLIIISGGIGTAGKDPGGFKSEAEYFTKVLEELGISKTNIISEDKATNTLENVLFGMEQINKNKLKIKTLLLVAMPFLLKRSKATFLKHYPEIKTYGNSFEIEKISWNNKLLERLLAEIDRLEKYAIKGDIAETLIPSEVSASYRKIKEFLEKL